jgi:hypothetical protein
MEKRPNTNIVITEDHRAKITLDMICQFMRLIRDDLPSTEKPNLTTEDYTLKQFQWWVGKKIDYNHKDKNSI